MIKNILYSLFLHSLLALAVYVSFRSNINEEKINLKDGVTVGIVSLASLENAVKVKKVAESLVEEKTSEKPAIIQPKPEKPKPPTAKPVAKKIQKSSKNIAKALNDKNSKFKKTDDEKTNNKTEEKIIEEKPVEPDSKLVEEEISTEKKEAVSEKTGAEKTELQPEIIADIVDNLETINLSAREKFNIQSQLRACYKRSIAGDEKNNLAVTVKVKVLQDGTIDFNMEEIIDTARYNNSQEINYKNRVDDILETLELCSPLRNLPIDKYDIWQEFTIEFGEVEN